MSVSLYILYHTFNAKHLGDYVGEWQVTLSRTQLRLNFAGRAGLVDSGIRMGWDPMRYV